jgi:hypothetical protein
LIEIGAFIFVTFSKSCLWLHKSYAKHLCRRYTIQQKSNGRFVDVHVHSGEDFRLVTLTAQNNDMQRWLIRPSGVAGRAVCGIVLLDVRSNGHPVQRIGNINTLFTIAI